MNSSTFRISTVGDEEIPRLQVAMQHMPQPQWPGATKTRDMGKIWFRIFQFLGELGVKSHDCFGDFGFLHVQNHRRSVFG